MTTANRPRRPRARPEDIRALYRALLFVGAMFIALFFNAV